jgi:hypothetical protein
MESFLSLRSKPLEEPDSSERCSAALVFPWFEVNEVVYGSPKPIGERRVIPGEATAGVAAKLHVEDRDPMRVLAVETRNIIAIQIPRKWHKPLFWIENGESASQS